MAAVGLYIRLGILETPAFQRLVAEKRIERVPVLEVFKRQPKEIILSALARTGEQAPAYIFLAFVFAYGTQVLHAPRNFLLSALIAGCAASLLVTPPFRIPFGSDWTQAVVPWWHDRDGDFRVHLFRLVKFPGARINLPCHCAFLGHAWHSLWTTGSVNRGVLHAPATLQRLFDWLSPRLDYGRRTRSSHCHCAISLDRIRLRDCLLHRRLRHCRLHRNGIHA
jgi:hypothetical protein